MKLLTLLSARAVLKNHINDKLPTRLAYKLMKLIKASDTEGAFYDEKMKKIIDEFADRDDGGNVKMKKNDVVIKPDKLNECNAAITDLQQTEVDKPDISFTVEELEPLEVSISEIAALDDFITSDGG